MLLYGMGQSLSRCADESCLLSGLLNIVALLGMFFL